MKKLHDFRIPAAPKSITKGSSLALLLDKEALDCLAWNISLVFSDFDGPRFKKAARLGLQELGILERALHIANTLRQFLPESYSRAVGVLVKSLGSPLTQTSDIGLAPFFYLPHVSYVAQFGWDKAFNFGEDPFEDSMAAQHAMTQRFSAEFSMRPFLIHHQTRTLKQLMKWTRDSNPHVRRLCSEGARPRLPWAVHIPAFIQNPDPVKPILEALKDDEDLYVRRSVANHLGDIAKNHPEWAFGLIEEWLVDASKDRKWVIRHSLRHPAKKGLSRALKLRAAAK